MSRNILYTGAAQRDVHLASLRTRYSAFVSVKDISHRPDMSRLKHVSFEKKRDGRSGFKVIYNGKQLLSLASKQDAEAFITKHLRSIGKIGMNDPPPVKAKCRPRAKPKSKICGIIWRPESRMYEGSNHYIGKHTSLESAKAALDRKVKDGSIKPKGKVLKSGLRLGRIPKPGSEVRASNRKNVQKC